MTLVAVLLLAGCASEDESSTTTVTRSYNDPLLDRYAGNFDYQKGDDGSTKVVSERRSSFEGARAEAFDKGFQGKSYEGAEVEKAPWWGRKGYEAQVWNGGKSASEGSKRSWFGSKTPSEAGRTARANGQTLADGRLRDGRGVGAGDQAARQAADAITENRRADYPQFEVIGWEEQRRMEVGADEGDSGEIVDSGWWMEDGGSEDGGSGVVDGFRRRCRWRGARCRRVRWGPW